MNTEARPSRAPGPAADRQNQAAIPGNAYGTPPQAHWSEVLPRVSLYYWIHSGSIYYDGAKPKKGPQLLSLSGKFARGGTIALCVLLLAIGGCRSHRGDPTKSSPEVIYKKAHKSLVSYDFQAAIKGYEQLTARFPFTDQARQARLDLIYAYYRAGEGESATDAAETFIRENPTHPRVDYAWYIKGLVDFERQPNALEKLFHVDLSQRPPSTARKAFSAFRTVVEQYPKS